MKHKCCVRVVTAA